MHLVRRPHPVTAANANFHFGSFTVVGRRAINIVFYTLAIHVHRNVKWYDGETKKNPDIILFCFFLNCIIIFFYYLNLTSVLWSDSEFIPPYYFRGKFLKKTEPSVVMSCVTVCPIASCVSRKTLCQNRRQRRHKYQKKEDNFGYADNVFLK